MTQVLELLAARLSPPTPRQAPVAASEDKASAVLAELRRELAGAERIGDKIHQISAMLQPLIPHDILRIAVYDARGHNVTQHSLGKGKNLLSERNKSISRQYVLDSEHCSLRLKVVNNHQLADSAFQDDSWLVSCGATAAVTIPIMAGGRIFAAIAFASEQAIPSTAMSDATLTNSDHAVAVDQERHFFPSVDLLQSPDIGSFWRSSNSCLEARIPTSSWRNWQIKWSIKCRSPAVEFGATTANLTNWKWSHNRKFGKRRNE